MENQKVISTKGVKMLVNGKSGLDVVGDTFVLVSPSENTVKVCSGDKVLTKDIDGAVSAVVHPTGNHIFVTTEKGMIHLLVFETDGELVEVVVFSGVEKDFNGKITSIGIHPDGLILSVGRSDGKFSLYDLSTQTVAATFDPIEEGEITCMDFSEKGLHIATGSSNGKVTVWDLRKQKSIATMNIEGGSGIECVRFCQTGKFLAYGDADGHISVTVVKEWDVKVELNDTTAKGRVSGLAWGNDAHVLYASYSDDRSVRLWQKK
jgi:pre-mRNA-processing factor 19